MTLQQFAVRLTIPAVLASVVWAVPPAPAADSAVSYKLLATNKTKTIRKEMNEAATLGYRFSVTMAGETLGGREVVVVMSKPANTPAAQLYEYELLATKKTSTMQKELRQAGAEGFRYCGQSVAKTTFGGQEVIVILERAIDNPAKTYAYQLASTSRTKTMEKELNKAGEEGFRLMGLTVAETTFGGQELVSILMLWVPAENSSHLPLPSRCAH